MTVTAVISTKGRYFTTLPLAILGICSQTVRPKQLVIFDDNDEMKDLRGLSPYSHLFPLLMEKGIQWFHLPGGKIGQVANHATALERADTDFLWRMDDDTSPDPRCLERLLEQMKDPAVGAVGGLIHDPKSMSQRPSFITGKIEDIYSLNIQWYRWAETAKAEEVDHLYSTFLYRVEAGRKAGGYCKTLSPVGHREETMFSHEIKRAGYKLLVTPEALTWHFREGTGGIRSYTDGSLWARDEQVFRSKLAEWKVTPNEYKFVVLNSGIGDHFMFKSVLPELISRNAGKRIVLAVCYPEVFKDVQGVTLASIGDAEAAFGNLNQWNIYKWCEEHQWKKPMPDAYRLMYS